MEKYFNIINNFINTKYINNFPIEIHEKIKYLFNDGKRIRPILSLCFCSIENENPSEIILNLCISIEIIHCLSLVIDDLPEMDNDFIRRGKDAFHIKYGQEYTNFFIYYILNKLFMILNNGLDDGLGNGLNGGLGDGLGGSGCNINELNIKYARDIMHLFKVNLNNLIDGQYIDMEFNKQITETQASNTCCNIDILYEIVIEVIFSFLEDIDIDMDIELLVQDKQNILDRKIYENIILNLKKTGTLFALSINIGYLLQLWNRKIDRHSSKNKYTNIVGTISIEDSVAGDSVAGDSVNGIAVDSIDNIFDIVAIWGYMFGYIFQISDDILDYEKDKGENKPNICVILGKENTIILFNHCCNWLRNLLKTINENSLRCWKTFFIDIETINQLIYKIENRIL